MFSTPVWCFLVFLGTSAQGLSLARSVLPCWGQRSGAGESVQANRVFTPAWLHVLLTQNLTALPWMCRRSGAGVYGEGVTAQMRITVLRFKRNSRARRDLLQPCANLSLTASSIAGGTRFQAQPRHVPEPVPLADICFSMFSCSCVSVSAAGPTVWSFVVILHSSSS